MHTIKNRVHLLISFAFILTLPLLSHGQARDKKKTVDLLCQKWESNFAKSPKKMECFPPDADSSIRFLPNGYIIFSEKKGPEGAWNYDANRNNLYVIINGNLWKYSINSLTATELALEGTANQHSTVWFLLKSNE
jgi:hypothetical protein